MEVIPIPTISEEEFFRRLKDSLSSCEILDMTDEVVCLEKVIRLRRRDSLYIRGGVIHGAASTIFSLGTDRKNGPPALILESTKLYHTYECKKNESPYAVIFAQGKAKIELNFVHVFSAFGIGLWCKHGSQATLRGCIFGRCGHSAVACFNNARADLSQCTVENALHGLCIKGTSKVVATSCDIRNCVDIAVVVYQQGALTLEECLISNTRNKLLSAIHVEASGFGDSVCLNISQCRIVDNEGSSVTLHGSVVDEFRENVIDGPMIDNKLTVVDGHSSLQFSSIPNSTLHTSVESILTEAEFEERLHHSLQVSEPLDMSNCVVSITHPIRVPSFKHLIVVNGTIIGKCHSIFLLDNNCSDSKVSEADSKWLTLTLQGTKLFHYHYSPEKRGVGAAIFVHGVARIDLSEVHFESSYGFGLWLKHNAEAKVYKCTFKNIGRSAVACFNDVRVQLNDCKIDGARIHGICVRGTSRASLSHCSISNCGTRAAFVYQQGSLSLECCEVSNTQNSMTPAIHAEAAGVNDKCFLILTRCHVFKNTGPGVVVAGKAMHDFVDNIYDFPPIFAPEVNETTIPRPWCDLNKDYNALLS